MKKCISLLSALGCAVALAAENPKYVFLFIGDGMSVPQRMTAEEFARHSGYGELAINVMPQQAMTRTRSATSVITDSAAAATAIACGEKTYNGAIGVDVKTNRLVSVAEIAKQAGKKVGIATTVTICHATPAGFYAHRKHRGDGYGIGLDLIASGFDFFAGGGFGGANRNDKHGEYKGDIYKLAAKSGMTVISPDQKDRHERFRALKPGCGRVLYSHSVGEMPFSIDAEKGDVSIAEITAKGIELLDNDKGFFFMIEGGKIDYAGHGNDAATNLHDILGLDAAVKVALEFAKKHPEETLVVVTGDHETGGMAMGFAKTGYALHFDRLALQKCSSGRFDGVVKEAREKELKEGGVFDFEDIKLLLSGYFGFRFTKDEGADQSGGKFDVDDDNEQFIQMEEGDIKELEKAFKENHLGNTAKWIIDAKSGIGWSSGAHTALPVLTTAQGAGAEIFHGFIENTDISRKLKDLVK